MSSLCTLPADTMSVLCDAWLMLVSHGVFSLRLYVAACGAVAVCLC